ncbi:MAG TPA: fasciclin domain-containing protein [Flavisolibacter sp.]|nr:fasciclin domain-containing protein [Flavisolibacter sp.]
MKVAIIKYMLCCLLIAGFVSCKKEEKTTSSPTLDAYLKSEPTLSLFSKALIKANLESYINGPGPFTWFAPSNDAFTAAGITEDSLNKMTQGQINYLLMYHLVSSDLNGENMIAINSSPRNTGLGTGAGQAYIGSSNNENFVNGTKLISRDNAVTNGYVHIINRVNVPPVLRGSVQAVLTRTGQHTLFIQALTRAGLWTSFGTASVFTVFAPTDAAMTAAGYSSGSITAAPVATLAAAMRYHYILNTRLFTNDLMKTTIPSTAVGSSSYLTTSDNGTKVKGKNNPTAVNITNSDNLGLNGVVHVINGVLRP